MKKTYKINLPKDMTIKPGSIGYCYDNDRLDNSVEFEKKKYEPQDGDIIAFASDKDSLNICIFKSKRWDKSMKCYIYEFYCQYNSKKGIMPGWGKIYPPTEINIRPANSEEKMILEKNLDDVFVMWNPETKELGYTKWRAKVGGQYFFVDLMGGFFVNAGTDDRCLWTNNNYHMGNYYKTKEAAEEVSYKIQNAVSQILKNSKTE